MVTSIIPETVPTPDLTKVHHEFRELLSACGVYDLSSRVKISLTGSDRVRWLNGMVTNNIRDLATGRGVYAFLLNPQGRILGDLYAYNRGDSITVDTDQAQSEKLLATFDHYIIMDDVEVSKLGQLTAIGIAGPKARQALQTAGFEIPELEALQSAETNWRNNPVTVARGDNPSVETYEVWLASDKVTAVRDALVQAGAKPVSANAMELLRVAAGIPRYGQDIRERDLPQETEQQRALNFSKGCYVGQEIVERIRSRGAVHRMFTGFDVQGELPALGTKIQSDGRDVGEITTTASLPVAGGERRVALGYIRREIGTPAKQLQLDNTQISVATLPFSTIFKRENL
ncbi:MAG TPA: folate-binding protein [Terriglobales bacterium]|jgi:folate-binding protein YgfZ|nr:folate-binding protein [Terriglobales bacterium]